jgi:YidC/Oxa1 family membrane protein insertase
VHEGVSALIDGSLKELKLKDLKAGEPETFESGKSWFGFSDRYWFTSLILDDENTHNLKFSQPQDGVFQTDFRGAPVVLGGRATATESVRFFAGAKEIRLLDSYTDNHNIPKFDLAVDFGWYYFLTKPFFYILTFLYGFIGNMGWAILLFAAMLRLLMFPIANKSYESMSKMKKLQPKILSLQEKYKGNQALLQQATMELYRREKINPASGCLPMFIQIPVFRDSASTVRGVDQGFVRAGPVDDFGMDTSACSGLYRCRCVADSDGADHVDSAKTQSGTDQ